MRRTSTKDITQQHLYLPLTKRARFYESNEITKKGSGLGLTVAIDPPVPQWGGRGPPGVLHPGRGGRGPAADGRGPVGVPCCCRSIRNTQGEKQRANYGLFVQTARFSLCKGNNGGTVECDGGIDQSIQSQIYPKNKLMFPFGQSNQSQLGVQFKAHS